MRTDEVSTYSFPEQATKYFLIGVGQWLFYMINHHKPLTASC